MRRSIRAVFFVAAAGLLPAVCSAQDLNPRAYVVTPVAYNAAIVTYGYSTGDILFDPGLPVTDARGSVHTPALAYYRALNFFGRSANITAGVPFAIGDIEGTLSGQARAIHRAGLADLSARLAVNLVGARALSAAEYAKVGQPRRVLGASLRISAPTGQYDPTRVINIGTHRWGFKPELGYMSRIGPMTLDVYGGVWLYTANDNYLASDADPAGNTRSQSPIGTFESHLSYDVKPRFWISGDINYWRGGQTSVNGVESAASLQSNSRFGLTGSVPLTRHQSIKLSYSRGMVVRVGGNFQIFTTAWQYGWTDPPGRK